MQRTFIFLFTVCFPFIIHAQETLSLSGEVNLTGVESYQLNYDPYYLGQKTISHKIPSSEHKFDFKCVMDRARVVDFNAGTHSWKFYLGPGDNLVINISDNAGTPQIKLEGKSAVDNRFLLEFNVKFQSDFSKTDAESRMKSKGVDAFEIELFKMRKAQTEFFKRSSDYATFSAGFRKYIENSIHYNYYWQLLGYPIVNGTANTGVNTVSALPAVMINEFDKKTANDENALISESYRNFVYYFVTYFASESNGFNKFSDYNLSANKKFIVANEFFKGLPFQYYVAKFLYDECERLSPETIKKMYKAIYESEKGGVFSSIINTRCDEWMNAKGGNLVSLASTPSGVFKMKDLKGREITMSEFKGKVVYVDFWASWCGPCLQQFPYAAELKKRFNEKQKKKIEFLYISIDATEAAWRKAIEDFTIQGYHGFSPGGWGSEAAKFFKLSGIPRYMLIDKKGNIVEPNAKRPGQEGIYEDILKLLE